MQMFEEVLEVHLQIKTEKHLNKYTLYNRLN